ncbi:LOW QUALITY PROTEIN: hypothetical protein V1477_009753 [Vespula maculifrons]|uniref:Uncharacterized protein n=1 Tax=Vespula maculifrons TaxID=7453 RepID=A0ABD2CBJ3_VESMC
MLRLPFLLFLFFSSSSRISIYRRSSDLSSNGSVHDRSLDANTGRIRRTLTRVSAGTGVVFSGAIKSPTPVGPQMQLPPRGGTWVGSTFVVTKFNGMEVFPSEWLHISRFFQDLFYVIPNFISHLLFTFLTPFVYSAINSQSFLFIGSRSSSRVGPMSGAHGRGLQCGSPFSIEKSSLSFVLPFNVSSNGLFHIRLLDGNTGKIERTFARVSAGTGVVFPGAIKSPTIMDFSHSDIHVSVRARLKVLPRTSFYLFGDYLLTPVSRILESRIPLVGPQMQQPPRGGTWVGSTYNILKSIMIQVLPGEWLHVSVKFQKLFILIIIKY